ncbi:MAG: PilN domain-containing protein [Acidobacteria bacterium]|nr:PilN domain-containing protein [Acidobacteriota bacterium]
MRALAREEAARALPRARINLVPPEIAERRRNRQRAGGLVAAGMALVVLLGAVYALQQVRLAKEQRRLEAQAEVNAGLKAKAAKLSEFERLETQATQRASLLQRLTAGEVRWSAVLADLSLAIPSNVWVTTFSGTLSAPVAAGPGAAKAAIAGPPTIGELQLAGVTFEHVDVARWLTRLAEVKEFTFPYLSLSQKSEMFDRTVVQFSSTVKLGESALRSHQRVGRREP